MAKGFKHGVGGNPLNFKVVGGTSQPTDPKENMIWVNTDTEITDWVFSATQPSAKSGRVWITTGTSSTVEFNALKKNGIQVYPISAKQYVYGAWVDKEAKIYQVGEWVDWHTYLFNAGQDKTGITGGWVAEGKYTSNNSATGAKAPVITNNGDSVTIAGSEGPHSGIYRTQNKIPVESKSKITFKGSTYGSESSWHQLILWSALDSYWDRNIVASVNIPVGGNQTAYIDLSNVPEGSYYVGFFVYSDHTVTMKKLYLE